MALYQRIASTGDTIAKNIGNTIPVSEDLDNFIRHVKSLPNMNKDNMYIILSGYSKNVADRSERDTFISQYRAVESALSSLTKGPGGAAFKGMQQAIAALLKAIDDFNDKMVKAITEINIDRPEDISSSVRGAVSDVYGSGEDDSYVNSFVAFTKVQNDLAYYYNIATVRDNLKRVSVELKSYGNDYEAVLGEEAGWMINQIRKEYNAELAGLADTVEEKDKTVRGESINAGGDANAQSSARSATRYFLERQRDSKVKMIEVAQAVDLYLKEFTNGVASKICC
jgi:hypothetical protein